MNCLAVRSLLPPPLSISLACNDLAICLKLGLFAYLRAGHVDGFADIYCLKAITPAPPGCPTLSPQPPLRNRRDSTPFLIVFGQLPTPLCRREGEGVLANGEALKFYALTLIVEMFNCFVIIAGSYCFTHTVAYIIHTYVCVCVCV